MTSPSYTRIIIIEVDVLWTLCISPHEILITRRPLILRVAREHALNAHAHALHILDRTPPLATQQIQADNAIGVNMWMDGDWTVWGLDKGHLRSFCRKSKRLTLAIVERQHHHGTRESIPIG
jgi:hypothetical protein